MPHATMGEAGPGMRNRGGPLRTAGMVVCIAVAAVLLSLKSVSSSPRQKRESIVQSMQS